MAVMLREKAPARTGRMTAARWDAGAEQLKSLGILHGAVDPATAYSLKFQP